MVDALLGKKPVAERTWATLKRFDDYREYVHEERETSNRCQEEREHELRKLAQEGGEGSA